jgi:hypothetical protein
VLPVLGITEVASFFPVHAHMDGTRVLYDATATPAAVAHDLDILLRRS